MPIRFTACPECLAPAELTPLGRVGSSDGPVRLVRVGCIRRHVFVLEEASLRAHLRAAMPSTQDGDLEDLAG